MFWLGPWHSGQYWLSYNFGGNILLRNYFWMFTDRNVKYFHCISREDIIQNCLILLTRVSYIINIIFTKKNISKSSFAWLSIYSLQHHEGRENNSLSCFRSQGVTMAHDSQQKNSRRWDWDRLPAAQWEIPRVAKESHLLATILNVNCLPIIEGIRILHFISQIILQLMSE